MTEIITMAKLIGSGLATISLAGSGVGIGSGLVFVSLLGGVSRTLSFLKKIIWLFFIRFRINN
jgi:F0F1-type ATP synthase membrane subunit c/vacuolar-type H+-ATPase subunit K